MPSRENGEAPYAASHLTAFERAWNAAGVGKTIMPCREPTYERQHGMLFLPLTYVEQDIRIRHANDEKSEQWVASALGALIRSEFDRTENSQPLPRRQQAPRRGYLSESIMLDYLDVCTESLVYEGSVQAIANDPTTDIAQKVSLLLADPVLGNRKNRDNFDVAGLRRIVEAGMKMRAPLQLVLPAFPFKDQNPFRTDVRASQIDIGDVALLVRLHCIALAIAQVYPYDAEWLIVSDGTAYAGMFNVPRSDAVQYSACLREIRNRLNLWRTIHIVDLEDLVDRYPLRPVFQRAREDVQTWVDDPSNRDEAYENLVQGMAWNTNTRDLVTHQRGALWRVLNSLNDVARRDRDLRENVRGRAMKGAAEYAAFNLAMKRTGLLEAYFPGAIRATSHAKPGQVAIPRLGAVASWNGVGVLAKGPLGATSITSTPLHDVMRRPDARALMLYGTDVPFVYQHD